MKYKWVIKESQEITKEFLEVAYNSKIIASLLLNREIDSPEKARAFLDPKFYKESSPYEIPDLLKARDRIIKAINEKEKITIFGDYDVDGVTSTSCLLLVLRQCTDKVDFYIPNRLTEGYGLNVKAVETIAKKNKKNCNGKPLLITCDCGITNTKEIELANKLGMDVIVTDHHSLPEILPPACAVLNPKQLPSDHKLHFLPGVGVAYKLAEAILESINNVSRHCEKSNDEAISKTFGDCRVGTKVPPRNDIKPEDLLDLVTLGMIADLAPLVDENRYLVQIGLEKLANTKKIGLKELLKMGAGTQSVNTEHVGFGIAPRINAVGRLTDAALAVKLLTTDNLLEAVQLSCELDVQNRERQQICESTLEEAVTLVSEKVDLEHDKCIVLANDGWHHGVIGIVASRIVEKYSLPTLLIAVDKEQNIARGSGRSVERLNIVDALVKSSKHLEKFGGHKAACGLSVKPENLDNFIFDFTSTVNEILSDADLSPVLKIDLELPLSVLNFELLNLIYKLSPFGFGNKLPVFLSEEVEIVSVRSIGKNGQHLKLQLKTQIDGKEKIFEGLIWNFEGDIEFKPKDKLKIAYVPKINTYNGETFIQLEIKDWELVQRRDAINRVSTKVQLFDFRGKMQECLNLFSAESTRTLYFAETSQKNYLPLETCSRNRLTKTENLILLDIPPDEVSFAYIVQQSSPSKMFFAFDETDFRNMCNSDEILKKLSGMIKYIKTNKNSKVKESDLQAALGINKNSLVFALETLVKIGFLSYERTGNELNINILTPSRQNYDLLIEYNLLVSELRQITQFREWILNAELKEISKILDQHNIKSEIISIQQERVTI